MITTIAFATFMPKFRFSKDIFLYLFLLILSFFCLPENVRSSNAPLEQSPPPWYLWYQTLVLHPQAGDWQYIDLTCSVHKPPRAQSPPSFFCWDYKTVYYLNLISIMKVTIAAVFMFSFPLRFSAFLAVNHAGQIHLPDL